MCKLFTPLFTNNKCPCFSKKKALVWRNLIRKRERERANRVTQDTLRVENAFYTQTQSSLFFSFFLFCNKAIKVQVTHGKTPTEIQTLEEKLTLMVLVLVLVVVIVAVASLCTWTMYTSAYIRWCVSSTPSMYIHIQAHKKTHIPVRISVCLCVRAQL